MYIVPNDLKFILLWKYQDSHNIYIYIYIYIYTDKFWESEFPVLRSRSRAQVNSREWFLEKHYNGKRSSMETDLESYPQSWGQ